VQLSLFDPPPIKNREQLLLDLFKAYYDARKNKRSTINQLKFEINYEQNIFELYEEIIAYNYKPKQSICFVVTQPVKREIFAADFRDRVIHHLIYNYIMPVFDKTFINDSYSCRKGKGTHYGIGRISKFIRSCSQKYKQDCYILKLDISGYFMAINKDILFEQVKTKLQQKSNKINFDLPLILYLIEKTIYYQPTKNYIIKGDKADWEGLPPSKSLFYSKPNCGLPIGNLTSQLFSNIYMNEFDHWVKQTLGIKYYGRYVDDFVLIHQDKEYLKILIEPIKEYLENNLNLILHPKKIHLQHFSKGVKYLGVVIKPYRSYIANRTKGKFYDAIETQNKIIVNHKPTIEEQEKFINSMNSYLGIMKHYKTYKLSQQMIFNNLSHWWWHQAHLSEDLSKFVLSGKQETKIGELFNEVLEYHCRRDCESHRQCPLRATPSVI